jgi:FG-GAP-like repeat/FG-GAP repeat
MRVWLTAVLWMGCAERPLYLPEATADLSPAQDLSVPDAGADLSVVDLAMPDLALPLLRQLSPLSTATVTSHRPTLRWSGGTAQARVDLCADRACGTLLGSATTAATGGSARPDAPLAPGVVFWRVREGSAVTPLWELWVGARDAATDTSWGATLDVNGDGHPDVAVANRYAVAGVEPGYVYLGGPNGPTTTPAAMLADDTVKAPDWYGMWKVAAAGDLDGDGFGDLAFSSIQADLPGSPPNLGGMVHVLYGSAGGLDMSRTVVLRGPADTYEFGRSFLGGVDINGDGYGDLVVTSLSFNAPFFVFFGGPQGVSASSQQRVTTTSINAGLSLAAGDFNGDGRGDLALSTQDDIGNNFGAGRVLVYYGSPNGLGPQAHIDAPPNAKAFSFVLGVFDHDGDGFADLVAAGTNASPAYDAHLFIYHGAPGGLPTTASAQVAPPTDLVDAQPAGDVDGDGRDDLLFSQRGLTSVPGHAALYLSGPGALQPLAGPGEFGSSLAGANDVDHDGHPDVLIGAPDQPLGRVFFFFGGPAGVVNADMGRLVEIDSPPVDGGSAFGAFVSGSY